MLNVPISMKAQGTLAFIFSPKLARYLETTIFKIGKPNYRF